MNNEQLELIKSKLDAAGNKVGAALVLAWRDDTLTETQRLKKIEGQLHAAVNDLVTIKNVIRREQKSMSQHVVNVKLDDGSWVPHTEPTKEDAVACADLLLPLQHVVEIVVRPVDSLEIVYRLPKED